MQKRCPQCWRKGEWWLTEVNDGHCLGVSQRQETACPLRESRVAIIARLASRLPAVGAAATELLVPSSVQGNNPPLRCTSLLQSSGARVCWRRALQGLLALPWLGGGVGGLAWFGLGAEVCIAHDGMLRDLFVALRGGGQWWHGQLQGIGPSGGELLYPHILNPFRAQIPAHYEIMSSISSDKSTHNNDINNLKGPGMHPSSLLSTTPKKHPPSNQR